MENKDKTFEDVFEETNQIEARIIRSLGDGKGMISPLTSVPALAKASAAVIATTVAEGYEEAAMDKFCETARTLLRHQLEAAREYKKGKGQ